MQRMLRVLVSIALIAALSAPAALAVSDEFNANPLLPGSAWSFGIGSNANSQFSFSPGELAVHIDSSLPTARIDKPLGFSLNDSTSFLLSARFRFHVISAPSDQAAQISFGLTNSALTGGDRTGSPGNFSSDNTFHTVEFTYFPSVSQFGPTLAPAVFGGPNGGDAFSNFTSVFGPPSILSDNATGITALPQDIALEAQLAYDGPNKTATLTVYQVLAGGSLVLLETGLTPLALDAVFSGYDLSQSFLVDTLSIMAYKDNFTTAEDPSLVADVTFDSISLVVPEPSALLLASLGLAALAGVRWRVRSLKGVG